MQAIRYHEHGSADVLKLENVGVPSPKSGELLVRVRAAGVNPVDWKQRSGMNPNLPAIPGIDLSGLVEEIGRDVVGFTVGQEVWGVGRGTYAEFAIATDGNLVPKPDHMTFEEAASIGVGARTAWAALFQSAGLHSDHTILIQGAAGGVGMWAVQFAKWKGARVIGTASSGNIEFLDSMGTDQSVDYTTTTIESLAEEVDVVLDTVGGEVQEKSWQAVKTGGVLVTIVGQPDMEKAKEHGVRALRVGSIVNSIKIFSTVNELVTSGSARPQIQQVFSLENAKQAHELSETLHGSGRIVLRIPE